MISADLGLTANYVCIYSTYDNDATHHPNTRDTKGDFKMTIITAIALGTIAGLGFVAMFYGMKAGMKFAGL